MNEGISISNPLVYIILPCFNSEKYILTQLLSIYLQSYTNRKLIIINDGSTDNTLQIIKNFITDYKLKNKIKVFNKKNGGLNSAISKGLQEVKKMCNIHKSNDYISYCDSDDIRTRDKIEIQVSYMINHPDCDLSYHDLLCVNQNGALINKPSLMSSFYHKDTSFLYIATIGNFIAAIEMMFKIKYIDDILPMPIGYGLAQDYWTALVFSLNKRNIQYINQLLGYYRQHHFGLQYKLENGDISQKNKSFLKYFESLEKRFHSKNILYAKKYNIEKINLYEKGYSRMYIYIITLFKYTRIFILGLKGYIYSRFNPILTTIKNIG